MCQRYQRVLFRGLKLFSFLWIVQEKYTGEIMSTCSSHTHPLSIFLSKNDPWIVQSLRPTRWVGWAAKRGTKKNSPTIKWHWWYRSCENGGAVRAAGSLKVGICSAMGKKHRRWICRILPPRLFSWCLAEIWISLKITWGPLNANFSECAKPLL